MRKSQHNTLSIQIMSAYQSITLMLIAFDSDAPSWGRLHQSPGSPGNLITHSNPDASLYNSFYHHMLRIALPGFPRSGTPASPCQGLHALTCGCMLFRDATPQGSWPTVSPAMCSRPCQFFRRRLNSSLGATGGMKRFQGTGRCRALFPAYGNPFFTEQRSRLLVFGAVGRRVEVCKRWRTRKDFGRVFRANSCARCSSLEYCITRDLGRACPILPESSPLRLDGFA